MRGHPEDLPEELIVGQLFWLGVRAKTGERQGASRFQYQDQRLRNP